MYPVRDRGVPQVGSDRRQVLVRAVDGGADTDLHQLGAFHVPDRNDVAWRVWNGDERHQLRQVDALDLLVVRAGRVQRPELLGTPLRGQPPVGLVIGGEDGAGGAGLHDHVADGATRAHAQPGYVLAEELEDDAATSADAVPPEQLEDDVLGLDGRLERTGELDADHSRARDGCAVARHGHCHVQPACAGGKHAHGPRHRAVGVRTHGQLARA